MAVNAGKVYCAVMSGDPDQAPVGDGKPASDLMGSEVSAEERIEILARIDAAVLRARAAAAPQDADEDSGSRGIFLPILVNGAALCVIALAAVFLPMFFNRQEQGLGQGAGTAPIGENAIVSAVRREAENKLTIKDKEIVTIQDSLQQTSRQLGVVKADADARLKAKEEELRAAFDARLAAERARLQGTGATQASIDTRIATLRASMQSSYDTRLAEFKKQLAAETSAKEAALTAQLSGAQKSLAQAQEEKKRLQNQSESASRAATSAEGEQARLAQELAALQNQGQREQLVIDQISSAYSSVGTAMKAARFEDALGSLTSLAAYLGQPSVAGLPSVQRRKPVDLFLIDSLQRLVVSEKAAAQSPAAPAALPGQPAQAAQGAVAPSAARTAAPADSVAAADASARPAVDRADALARRGKYSEVIAAYAAVVRTWPESSLVPRCMNGIEGAVASLLKKADDDAVARDNARRAGAGEKIAAVASGFASAAGAAEAAAASAQKELIASLDAKVKVKTVLASEAVKSRYPELADALDRYLRLYGEEMTAAGRALALQDIGTVLDFLLGKKGKDAVVPLWSLYGEKGEHAAFQQLLDKIRGLTE